MEGNVVQDEEGRELSRLLVVKFKVSDREAVGVEERQHSFEGRDNRQAQCETSWRGSG